MCFIVNAISIFFEYLLAVSTFKQQVIIKAGAESHLIGKHDYIKS